MEPESDSERLARRCACLADAREEEAEVCAAMGPSLFPWGSWETPRHDDTRRSHVLGQFPQGRPTPSPYQTTTPSTSHPNSSSALGVIDGRDMIAVPEPPGGGLDQPGQAGGDVVGVPGAVLGEGFQRLPVSGPLQGQDRLGDGVLLAVDGHGGDPFGEPAKAGAGEGPGEGRQQGLPDRPGELSFGHDASPVSGPVGFGTTWQVRTRRRCFSIRYARSVVVEFFVETTD